MSGKAVIKYLTTLQTRRYSTLWNVCTQKSQWQRVKWSELPCKTQSFKTVDQNMHPMMFASFCSLMKRYLQWPHRKICRMTDCTHIHQSGRKSSRQNVCARSVADDSSRRLLQVLGIIQLVPARHMSISSEFFIFQQEILYLITALPESYC